MRVLRAVAVPRLGEALRVLGNIDKVPAEGLVALRTNLVGPVGDRGQSVVADQRLDVALGDLAQALLRDVGDDPVPLPSPPVEGSCWGEDRYQYGGCCSPHRVPGWPSARLLTFLLQFLHDPLQFTDKHLRSRCLLEGLDQPAVKPELVFLRCVEPLP